MATHESHCKRGEENEIFQIGVITHSIGGGRSELGGNPNLQAYAKAACAVLSPTDPAFQTHCLTSSIRALVPVFLSLPPSPPSCMQENSAKSPG